MNAVSDEDDTPLLCAVNRQSYECAKVLLENGVDVNSAGHAIEAINQMAGPKNCETKNAEKF